MKNTFYSPLRYPGGKNKLSSYLKTTLKNNNLLGGNYIEPFAGGSAIALSLLIENYVNSIVINDLDRSIYAFWFSVLNHTEELCNKIENIEFNMDEWHFQKSIQLNKDTANLFDLGFSTLYLNRTNRSGIIKAGVIGGKNQDGNYKMDCRFNKKSIISRILKISEYKNRITLFNFSTEDLIKNYISTISETSDSLIYFDPPYYNKGQQLYSNFYNHNDHVNLSNLIKTHVNIPWILTYDNVEEIRSLYTEYNQQEFILNYSAGKKRKASEIMIFSKNINHQKLIAI